MQILSHLTAAEIAPIEGATEARMRVVEGRWAIARIAVIGLALIVVLAAPSARADTNTFEVNGTLFIQGLNNCAGPCVEALSFSFVIEFVPFVPAKNDNPAWTHKLLVHASNDVISAGPLGSFTMPGNTFPQNEPSPYVQFFNGPLGIGTVRDEMDIFLSSSWATSAPWIAPTFDSLAELFHCGTSACLDAFGGMRFGHATVAVTPVPEPMTLRFIGVGIAGVAGALRWRQSR